MQDLSKPIWIKPQSEKPSEKQYSVLLATPVHSDVSASYTTSLLDLQQKMMIKGHKISFSIMKSSLITQGRNLCVADFMARKDDYTHFLFIDSDIEFQADTIFKMLDADKELIAAPYPLKVLDWSKIHSRTKEHDLDQESMSRSGFTWPMKNEKSDEVIVKKGIMEVTHAPTGCMLIKKQVFEKMIAAYPERKIVQKSFVNGGYVEKPYLYNLFDTYHEPETKKYYGEDFGFCKRWTEIGGKCFIYVMDSVTHVGEYKYSGSLLDDLRLVNRKKIDD